MRMVLIALLILFSSPAHAVNWCEDSNIIGCYTIEDGTGIVITDISSNSKDIGFESGSTSTYPSWVSSSLTSSGKFDGSSDYALDYDGNDYTYRDLYTDITKTADFSATVWVNIDNVTNLEVIMQQSVASDNRFVMASLSSSKISVGLYTGSWNSKSSTSTISASTWYHIGMTWDTDTSTVVFYQDGVPQNGTDNGTTSSGSPNIFFGRRTDGTSYFNGIQDEISFFSSTLSSTDINDIMDNGLVQTESSHRIPTMTELRNVTFRGVTIR